MTWEWFQKSGMSESVAQLLYEPVLVTFKRLVKQMQKHSYPLLIFLLFYLYSSYLNKEVES